jgi:UDP-GlcNAc3NAcA epimerase
MLGVPCITLRDNTEWIETVESGWNVLVGANIQDILLNIQQKFTESSFQSALFGDGNVVQQINKLIYLYINNNYIYRGLLHRSF